MAAALVCADAGYAAAALAAGVHVVLITGAGRRPAGSHPGRLAVLVGDPGDPADVAAAVAMAAELFGRT